MQLSIIIINYNVKFFLEQCLCSVQKAMAGIDAEVLVVDNCSRDGSLDYLLPKFPWVKFIASETNAGFAKANNAALKHCKGEYVLYLNPDTIIPENILQQCIGFLLNNKNTGAVGVRMIDGSGNYLPESKRAFPSPLVSFYKLSGLSALFSKSARFNKYALGNLSENEVHEVDVLCGAFIMAERKLLDKLKGFDEAFFMYGEDIDLCYRIQTAGRKLFYLGTTGIIHFKGESSLSDNRKYVKIFYEAMFVFVKKHFSGSSAFLMKFFLQAGILARALFSFIALPFRKFRKRLRTPKKANAIGFFLAGAQEDRASAKHILATNGITVQNESQIINAEIRDASIVFCTGQLSYESVIAFVVGHKERNTYYWHGSNTFCIIGSTDKNSTGTVFGFGG